MYHANESRYETMKYHRCGDSGLMLPEVSLGFWHNFGDTGVYENMRQMCFTAFDHGITHFDLANNYGPQPGSAEENLGKILREELSSYRDELIISSKAGFDMWPGPYGNWGSRKYLIASLDQSLKRLGSGLCGYFLSPPHGSGYAAGRNHGCTRPDRAKRKSTVCRSVQLRRGNDETRGCHLRRSALPVYYQPEFLQYL